MEGESRSDPVDPRLTPTSSRTSPQLDRNNSENTATSGDAERSAAAAAAAAAAARPAKAQSCALCQRRKVKCDKKRPCSTCVKKGVECVSIPPRPPRRRRRKLTEREFHERLRLCELLLEKNGIAPPVPISLSPLEGEDDHAGEDEDGEDDEGQHALSEDAEPHGFGRGRESASPDREFFPSRKRGGLYPPSTEVCRPPLLRPPSPVQIIMANLEQFRAFEKYVESTGAPNSPSHANGIDSPAGIGSPGIFHSYDVTFERFAGFPFLVGGRGRTVSLTDYHPPAVQIFQLWQLYLTNVNPLVKLTHTPTLQPRIVQAALDLAEVPKNLELLMFAIYITAVGSLHEAEFAVKFPGWERRALVGRWNEAVFQGFTNVDILCSSDLMVLQAFLLFVVGPTLRFIWPPETTLWFRN